jgi:ribosomal protein S17
MKNTIYIILWIILVLSGGHIIISIIGGGFGSISPFSFFSVLIIGSIVYIIENPDTKQNETESKNIYITENKNNRCLTEHDTIVSLNKRKLISSPGLYQAIIDKIIQEEEILKVTFLSMNPSEVVESRKLIKLKKYSEAASKQLYIKIQDNEIQLYSGQLVSIRVCEHYQTKELVVISISGSSSTKIESDEYNFDGTYAYTFYA